MNYYYYFTTSIKMELNLDAIADKIQKPNIPPKNKRIGKYTVETLLAAIQEKHGSRYEIVDRVLDNTKKDHWKVNVRCTICNYIWYVEPYTVTKGDNNCPGCSGVLKWDFNRFINESRRIHGDRYDYSRIKSEDVTYCNSKVPIR